MMKKLRSKAEVDEFVDFIKRDLAKGRAQREEMGISDQWLGKSTIAKDNTMTEHHLEALRAVEQETATLFSTIERSTLDTTKKAPRRGMKRL